ncbi:alpha/beta fold hydrolase [Methylobacterium sp. DB0501]|uniref:alpha/beta fold hydrolase n=1 Tax=Methylobacterium alsaeris TaxID=3344826 RepID=UPI0019D0CF58|nr:alpha/beta hydrolase [Methylobacterium sp. DB0501]
MFVSVNGVRLFVDVENAGLVPAGGAMREKATLLLLHGGPGFDHSGFKPWFSGLSDVAQVVYYDHRGNGRSEDGDRSAWTLAQWGDDVKGLCDALGLVRPIALGMSWGGYVAQSYATRYPDHPGKLFLVSTAAKFEFPAILDSFARLGGPEAARVAEAYWMAPTAERRADVIRICGPLYRRTPPDPEAIQRALIRHDTALHFYGPDNEQGAWTSGTPSPACLAPSSSWRAIRTRSRRSPSARRSRHPCRPIACASSVSRSAATASSATRPIRPSPSCATSSRPCKPTVSGYR